jgi:hypothetical protein
MALHPAAILLSCGRSNMEQLRSHPTVKLLAKTIALIYKNSEVHTQVAGGCEK